MADRRVRVAPPRPSLTGTLTASSEPISHALIASASSAPTPNEAYNAYLSTGWQIQAWAYFHSIGPLNFGMNWLSSATSRVALTIAEIVPGEQEPVPSDDKAANAILGQLKWDESQIMGDLALQVSVPGRGYLVGRELVKGVTDWTVYSPDQVRPVTASRKDSPTGYLWELWDGGREWIPLVNALVVVIRDPDPRYRWVDTSNVQAALTILREIDLYDRDIISSLVSRIASNGILLVPSEVSFPTREQYNDSDDPFMMELIEVAKQSIKDPGSASAAIPIPIKVPSQFIDKFRHLILASGVDPAVLNARREAYDILFDTLNLPKEILSGMGDVSHSAGLQADLSDSAIKMHIAPLVELICRDMTRGFLQPQLMADGESLVGPNGGKLVVWYDTSALAAKPDMSVNALAMYDRVELSGEAARSYTGFTEADAPDKAQIREQILKKIVNNAQLALTALNELTGTPSANSVGAGVDQSASAVGQQDQGKPANQGQNPGAPAADNGGDAPPADGGGA